MKRRSLSAALASAALVGGLGVTALQAPANAAGASSATLPGTASPLVSRAPVTGQVPGATRINFDVVLGLRDKAGAQALVKAVSTPGSPLYRHYLTAAQWEARFSPTTAQVHAVSSWLASHGISVQGASGDRTTVRASATASAIEQAFHTTISNRRFAGHVLRTVDTNLVIPSSLAGTVVGTAGISQTLATPALSNATDVPTATSTAGGNSPVAGNGPTPVPPPPAFVPAPPCGTYYGEKTANKLPALPGYNYPMPWLTCGYTPSQVRSAYGVAGNVSGGNNGSGVTVAIVDAYASPTLFQDAHHYSVLNDPSHVLTRSQVNWALPAYYDQESLCGASGWFSEQTLDVESVHATAPGANILYVGATDCQDSSLLAAEQEIVDGQLANVITNSWGDTAGDLLTDAATKTAYDQVFMQAGAEGISVLYSSGDNGDNYSVTGLTAPDYPAVSPYVTAVGGTTLEVGSNGQRTAEYGWSTARSILCTPTWEGVLTGCSSSTVGSWLPTSYDYGGGGGTSYYYQQPSFQTAAVPTSLADQNSNLTGVPNRVIPDIAAYADPTNGFLMGETESFPNNVVKYGQFREGGTSLASPTTAGLIALADQSAGAGLGFLDPALYSLQSNPTAFYDVTPPPSPTTEARNDYANGLNSANGVLNQARIINYQGGPETYCNGAGVCNSQTVSLYTAPGYDNMTGLGSPGSNFVADLAAQG